MVCTICGNCGGEYRWDWTDAFNKFGFNSGMGQIETPAVAQVLEEAGFVVYVGGPNVHNSIIVSIRKEGKEFIPFENPKYRFGYDNPREFFPQEIFFLLDAKFPA